MSTPAWKPLMSGSAATITARTSGSRPKPRMVSASRNQPATGNAFTGGFAITTSPTWSRTSERIIAVRLSDAPSDRLGGGGETRAMSAPLDFSGRVAFVTGGCRGIGAGIARRFLEAGADVVICCRHAPEAWPVGGGRPAAFVEADVREPDKIDDVVVFTTGRFGRLDVLVNNAGGAPPAH